MAKYKIYEGTYATRDRTEGAYDGKILCCFPPLLVFLTKSLAQGNRGGLQITWREKIPHKDRGCKEYEIVCA